MSEFLNSPLTTWLGLLADLITIAGIFFANKWIFNKYVNNINIGSSSDDVIKYMNRASQNDREKYKEVIKELGLKHIDIINDENGDSVLTIDDVK